jgi:hypothetical protein
MMEVGQLLAQGDSARRECVGGSGLVERWWKSMVFGMSPNAW